MAGKGIGVLIGGLIGWVIGGFIGGGIGWLLGGFISGLIVEGIARWSAKKEAAERARHDAEERARREEEERARREEEEQRRWLTTVPGLYDTARRLSREAETYFFQRNYSQALSSYEQALAKFQEAKDGATGLGANSPVSLEVLGQCISTTKQNIENCNIALDKEKVEALYKEAKNLLYQGATERTKGELFKARETVRIANQKADDAFAISNRRCFADANRELMSLLEQIRDEFNAIDAAMTRGITVTEFKEKPVLAPVGADAGVEVKTGSEDFRGYVRFRVSVINTRPTIIANVVVKLVVDEKFLYISHVEPDFPLRYNEITFGTINAGEAKTVAFYLDPQMCSISKVYAHVTFMDSKGRFSSVTSAEKEIGGKCPIFFTREQANTAILKNLIEKQLDKRDRKVYFIPAGLAPREAFSICKEAIEGRDIQHVRDVVTEKPFEAIAWYYGQTKATQENIVIAGIVREETNSIELFVATRDAQKLTWLLAELGRNLNDKLKEKGIVQIQQVNVTIKDSIIQRSTLSFGKEGVAKVDIADSVVYKSQM